MAKLIRSAVAAAVAGVLLAAAPCPAGRPPAGPDPEHVPHTPGDGILMAFSGLDGETPLQRQAVASLQDGGLTLRFHLPQEPVVRILLTDAHRLTWRAVTNDLLVADVAGDPFPLVVGFTAANMVVGRLPPNARAAFSGGDAGAVVMRDKVGDRTRFAFAYDPAGPRAAARTGTNALKVSIDTLVENRLDFFARVPHGSENLSTERARTLAKAFSVMKVNTCSPDPPIAHHWTTPARWPEKYQGLWATAFHAIGLMHLDVDLAKEILAALFSYQDEEGMIPGRTGPDRVAPAAEPPMLARAAWTVYRHDKTRDRQFLRTAFDTVGKQIAWYLKHRRMGGPPPPEKRLTYGSPLYAWSSAEEAGTPGSPRFATGSDVAAVDLSCYLASECRHLQRMARTLGYGVSARTWGRRADAVAEAARRHLWHPGQGFFFDRKGPNGEWVEVWSYAGLLPLALGVADEAQADRLAEHLVGKRFRAAAGIRTLSRNQAGYTGRKWEGAVWMPLNYLLVRGLQQRGRTKAADALAERALATVTRWYLRTGTLREFYAPEAGEGEDGTPAAALGAGTGGTRDYFPTAAVFADLVLRPQP